MRITLLTTNLARGGAEAQVAGLAQRLQARGHEVAVVSLVQPSAFVEELRAGGVAVYAPGVWRVPAVLRELRPEVLHCHMFHANVLGRLLGLAMPFRLTISTIHSVAESPRGGERVWPRDLLYRATRRLADRTLAVSQAIAQKYGADEVIPNGVDTERFHPPDAKQRNAEFTWLAVGRLMWKKDYGTLLEAFARLGRGRLWIAGEGPDEAALRAKASARVEFLGARGDVAELMRRADAFVLSSVVEGLPVVLLEAAASGLPAVATDVGGVGETSPAFVVPPRDAAALAEAMRRVMEMTDDERAALGRQARAFAVERFDWERVVECWEKVYGRRGRDRRISPTRAHRDLGST